MAQVDLAREGLRCMQAALLEVHPGAAQGLALFTQGGFSCKQVARVANQVKSYGSYFGENGEKVKTSETHTTVSIGLRFSHFTIRQMIFVSNSANNSHQNTHLICATRTALQATSRQIRLVEY